MSECLLAPHYTRFIAFTSKNDVKSETLKKTKCSEIYAYNLVPRAFPPDPILKGKALGTRLLCVLFAIFKFLNVSHHFHPSKVAVYRLPKAHSLLTIDLYCIFVKKINIRKKYINVLIFSFSRFLFAFVNRGRCTYTVL